MKTGLNLGCGHMTLPRERPDHHKIVPAALYTDPEITWVNVDKQCINGVDQCADVFVYPWPWEDNSIDLILAAHLVEHIPHGIIRGGQLESLTGGWFAWWNEAGRVLKPGGVAHILCPYGWSLSGLMDPTHTRYLVWETFGYLAPDPQAPFEYAVKYRWEAIASDQSFIQPTVNEAYAVGGDNHERTRSLLWAWAKTRINVIAEMYIALQVQK